jgi:hypothetical protein
MLQRLENAQKRRRKCIPTPIIRLLTAETLKHPPMLNQKESAIEEEKNNSEKFQVKKNK